MTLGPQYEYKETDHNVSLYLQDPENKVRQEVDRILADANSVDGGTP